VIWNTKLKAKRGFRAVDFTKLLFTHRSGIYVFRQLGPGQSQSESMSQHLKLFHKELKEGAKRTKFFRAASAVKILPVSSDNHLPPFKM